MNSNNMILNCFKNNKNTGFLCYRANDDMSYLNVDYAKKGGEEPLQTVLLSFCGMK